MADKLRIVFMGTPEFAVSSLKALLDAGEHVIAVVTAPDKLAGRGMQLASSPIKKFALEHGLRILQPEKLKSESFIQTLKELQPDLAIVVAFRMLPEIVWSLPKLGTFNLHASLLPQYRGAAPIHWAVINGETETGVTTFFLKHEIDTGEIILQQKVNIGSTETTGDLYEKLRQIGAILVVKTVNLIEKGQIKSTPQPNITHLKLAPKIFKEMCRIDWGKSGAVIFNFVRGLSPMPGAFTIADGKVLKIYRVQFEPLSHQLPVAQVLIQDNKICVAVRDGFIVLLDLQAEGKKRMNASEWLLGNTIKKLE